MLKGRLHAALCFALTVASFSAPSLAQTLRAVHVTLLALASDTGHPVVERSFHLLINARFRERVVNPDELILLPALGGLQIVGDERHTTHGSAGTDYVETITVVAHAAGEVHVGAAHFDAIDARSGKPSHFSSNELNLVVGGGAIQHPLAASLSNLVAALAKIALAALVLFGVLVLARRRSGPRSLSATPPQIDTSPVEQDPMQSNSQRLRSALGALKTRRDRVAVFDARAALWQTLGANGGATLHDVLQRTPSGNGTLTSALRATEQAAFIAEKHLPRALDDMIFSLECYLR